MNFTDPIPFKCAEFSHSGFYLAICKANELIIFDADSFSRVHSFTFEETIGAVQWSPDDKFVLVLLPKLHEVHMRCFDNTVVADQAENWQGSICDQVGGIEAAIWSPDSR